MGFLAPQRVRPDSQLWLPRVDHGALGNKPTVSRRDSNTCCTNGGSADCNRPWFLDTSLQRVGHLQTWSSGKQTFNTVRNEINASRPFGVRIGWKGGGGHFVIVEGYFPGTPQRVSMGDPWTGAADMDYATLANNYQSTGSWTHSYFTRT
jgi:hypothetical protein